MNDRYITINRALLDRLPYEDRYKAAGQIISQAKATASAYQDEVVADMLASGMTGAQVAEALGMSAARVSARKKNHEKRNFMITADHIRELFDATVTDTKGRNTPVLVLDGASDPCVVHTPTQEANDWKVVYGDEDLIGYMGEEWDQAAGEMLAVELTQELRDGRR